MLISGAISQSHFKSDIKRLRGKPLIISTNNEIMLMNPFIYKKTRNLLLKIFSNKPDKLNAVLNELDQSMGSSTSNLTKNYLKNYLNFNNKNIIILLWNGSSDRNILLRLGFNNIMLNLTAYDNYNNKCFYLNLYNFNNKYLISVYKIGYVNKNGRYLSLLETHELLCHKNHNITYMHDPVNDIKLTKCIFNYLTAKNGYYNILNKI